jgi:type IV pilus assembly PilX-like protein
MRHLKDLQCGAALIVALLILVVITVLSIAAMRNSTMQLRMASNEQLRTEAFQTAQAAVDYVIAIRSDPVSPVDSFPVIGGAGYTICTTNYVPACTYTEYSVTLSGGVFPVDSLGNKINQVKIERLSPDLRPPPRGTETSLDKYDVAAFSVDSRFDRSAEGMGKSELIQGFIVLVPKAI